MYVVLGEVGSMPPTPVQPRNLYPGRVRAGISTDLPVS